RRRRLERRSVRAASDLERPPGHAQAGGVDGLEARPFCGSQGRDSMIFTETPLPGAFRIDLEKRGDDRGFFARTFCENEFAEHALVQHFCQVNNSLSSEKGTLRGMHYQLAPKAETKIVRCIRGALFDMILDLRQDSPTFGKSFGAELTG